jgi:hypothetical protein
MKYKEIKFMIKNILMIIGIVMVAYSITACAKFQANDDIIYETKISYPINFESVNSDNIEKFEFKKSEWEEIEDIEKNSQDGNSWRTYLENNKIMVSSQQYISSLEFRFDVDNGYFISENNGEFGGKIDFIGNDGASYTVVECYPKEMFSINDDIYLLSGLTFGGSLYKIINIDGRWDVKKEVDLGGSPYTYMIDKNDIYMIIYTKNYDFETGIETRYSKIIKISTVNNNIEVQNLIDTIVLFANTMVKEDNILYIGIDGSIAIIDLNNNEIKFYTKK